MGVHRRPVHRFVAGEAVPGGVSAAAVAEACDVTDKDLVRAETVAVGASARWFGHPFAVDGADELTLVHTRTIVPTNDSRPATQAG